MHEHSASLRIAVGKATSSGTDPVVCAEHPFTDAIELPFDLPTRIYGGMLAIWHFRRILQRQFPLHLDRPREYLRFLAWCATWGRRKYRVLTELPAWDDELNRPIALPELKGDRWSGTYSVGQFLHGVAHYHYTTTGMAYQRRARDRAAKDYWRGARGEANLPAAPDWQVHALLARFGGEDTLAQYLTAPSERAGHPPGVILERLGLVAPAADGRPSAAPQPVPYEPSVFRSPVGQARYVPVPRKAVEAASMARLGTALLRRPPPDDAVSRVTSRIGRSPIRRATTTYPFGVNLFGHARGELGIGEDVRLTAMALSSQRIPFCIVDVVPGKGVSQLDKSVEQWITPAPRYAINLFCMTGFEHVRHLCEAGMSIYRKRYNIGMWPWELPNWPASCRFAYSIVDEIWAISRYTADAYRDAPCPVRWMPPAVSVADVAHQGRSAFGIPESSYAFLFTFDFNSTVARKNPAAVAQAFAQAFPQARREDVRLIIKASHVPTRNADWNRLKRLATADTRISLFAETLRKPEVLALMRATDCYVSLHRAEGFGRSIAEAISLQLHVIATGYSGNEDFCDPKTTGLVKYAMRPLASTEYFYADGQQWAEPDIAHAAELMRQAYEARRGRLGGNRAVNLPSEVGAIYAERIRAIGAELGTAAVSQ